VVCCRTLAQAGAIARHEPGLVDLALQEEVTVADLNVSAEKG